MNFAREVFASDASGHDFEHTMRVYRMAVRIAQEENADLVTVQLAALLHDVDDAKLSPETAEQLDRAVSFLKSHHIPQQQINDICAVISQISYSKGFGAPTTLEGMCVQDADRLDAMGAIGIARTFAFGGSRGRVLHDPERMDKTSSVEHFYDKLLKLKDLMNTQTGKRLAAERDAFMRAYLEQFYSEWEGKC
jgi:uncharacterized protein